jgi:serine/threonine-protein kinase
VPGKYSAPRISPDGKQAAITVDDGKEVYIGIYNLSGTQAIRPLTFGGHNTNPLWTRDGQRIIFQSDRDGDGGLFWQRADGSGPAERLTTPEKGVAHFADSASRTENVITVTAGGAIWALSLDDRKLKPIIPKPPMGVVANAEFSPDGHWLAYISIMRAGAPQIYVQAFPTGSPYKITQTGANLYPLWSPDGKQIFYLSVGAGRPRINTVDIHTQPSVEFGKPVSLPIEVCLRCDPGRQGRPYDIFNGSQFIATFPPDEAQSGDRPSQINTVQNWFSELKKQVPVK